MKTGFINVEHEAHYARYLLPCMIGYALLIGELLRLIRSNSGRRILALGLAAISVFVALADKGEAAYWEGRDFAEYSKTNDSWFESVAANTGAGSPIVLVYLNGVGEGRWSTQEAMRVYYILSQRHVRPNVYLGPVPPRPSVEEGARAAVQADRVTML